MKNQELDFGLISFPTCSDKGGQRAYGTLTIPVGFIESISREKRLGSQRVVVTLTDGSALIAGLSFKQAVLDLADAYLETEEGLVLTDPGSLK